MSNAARINWRAAVAELTATEINEGGGIALANTSSVASTGGAARMVADAIAAWGRLDIVVNNAGVTPNGQGIADASRTEWDRLVDVHLHGSVNVLRAAWPHLVASGAGRVVNTSSASALGMPFALTYGTAKASIIGLTRMLAVEGAAAGIKVNAVMPTAATRMTGDEFAPVYESMFEMEAGEFARRFPPSGVAAGVALLAHESVPCTGELFTIGGGRMARIFLGLTEGATAHDPADYLRQWDRVFSPARFAVVTDTWVNEASHVDADRVTWRTSTGA
jgi:NAD(P)-dependent dehydrogenase (short-subunit alcohol dehydrogenase family)